MESSQNNLSEPSRPSMDLSTVLPGKTDEKTSVSSNKTAIPPLKTSVSTDTKGVNAPGILTSNPIQLPRSISTHSITKQSGFGKIIDAVKSRLFPTKEQKCARYSKECEKLKEKIKIADQAYGYAINQHDSKNEKTYTALLGTYRNLMSLKNEFSDKREKIQKLGGEVPEVKLPVRDPAIELGLQLHQIEGSKLISYAAGGLKPVSIDEINKALGKTNENGFRNWIDIGKAIHADPALRNDIYKFAAANNAQTLQQLCEKHGVDPKVELGVRLKQLAERGELNTGGENPKPVTVNDINNAMRIKIGNEFKEYETWDDVAEAITSNPTVRTYINLYAKVNKIKALNELCEKHVFTAKLYQALSAQSIPPISQLAANSTVQTSQKLSIEDARKRNVTHVLEAPEGFATFQRAAPDLNGTDQVSNDATLTCQFANGVALVATADCAGHQENGFKAVQEGLEALQRTLKEEMEKGNITDSKQLQEICLKGITAFHQKLIENESEAATLAFHLVIPDPANGNYLDISVGIGDARNYVFHNSGTFEDTHPMPPSKNMGRAGTPLGLKEMQQLEVYYDCKATRIQPGTVVGCVSDGPGDNLSARVQNKTPSQVGKELGLEISEEATWDNQDSDELHTDYEYIQIMLRAKPLEKLFEKPSDLAKVAQQLGITLPANLDQNTWPPRNEELSKTWNDLESIQKRILYQHLKGKINDPPLNLSSSAKEIQDGIKNHVDVALKNAGVNEFVAKLANENDERKRKEIIFIETKEIDKRGAKPDDYSGAFYRAPLFPK